ncbi:NADH:flavin oxidoreductase [Duganella sp. FT80W]|uniref:NADH:flavin oxidoreductase n=1 Tax=Duganella guangzhouensis TaxID=2666084 RepID=A0A6I2KVD1_9BURK|nr:NADH-dependent flavin oxidoreductase [Duganella guangzhouensis]MRW89763.1 NADH:flavin oxidoreductase [Duganella guangzhouensis]
MKVNALKHSKLFEPMELLPGLSLRNRIVMAPMTTWASNDDGTVSDEEEAYYRRRAQHVGLVITGCTHVQANGIGFTGEFAAHDDRFIPSLRKLALAAKSGGAPAILQIFHAGVKTLPSLVSDVVAASAVVGDGGPFAPAIMPRELSDEEVVDVVKAYAEAARRAIAAGFDGVELHGAHGFLIQNFFSPHSNRRSDQWGGSLENRMRFPLAIVDAIKRTIAEHADRPFALGYRVSVEEDIEGGLTLADSLQLITRLIDAGASYIHASLGNALDQKPSTGAYSATIVGILHDHIGGRVPLMAAGRIKTPAQADSALDMGLSLVAVGQSLVINPEWMDYARDGRDSDVRLSISAGDVSRASIPGKLWEVISATPGWFDVVNS